MNPLLVLIATSAISSEPAANTPSVPPRLVVVISVDQLRPDYLTRFAHSFRPAKDKGVIGGFRFLMEQGTSFRAARYVHVPTATGPGHATILTGCGPAVNGIAGNDWFDRTTGKEVYCVEDHNALPVEGMGGGMSPANLKVTTVGDELKMATNGKSKVVGIAFKDRASILMAGHAADSVVWFDVKAGEWITSSHYGSKLPSWAREINAKRVPASELNRKWEPSLPASMYSETRLPPFEKAAKTPLFSHALDSDNKKGAYRNWATSPHGQKFIFDTVRAAVTQERLGADTTPDLLAINLSTNDYVGHAYGPNSPEVLDISHHTDTLLSDFFTHLDRTIPDGMKNVLVVLTADHGVMPIAEELANTYKVRSARRVDPEEIKKTIDKALSAQFGEDKWVAGMADGNFYLNRDAALKKKVVFADLERRAAEAASEVAGVQFAFTRTQLLAGSFLPWKWARRVAESFHPTLSGDVLVIESPGTYFGDGNGTGHGSPWIYDSQVPLFFAGWSFPSRQVTRPVSMNDVAPTLSLVLGIAPPSGSEGEILSEAIPQ